ncbi:hypothetical protein DFH11DRAFT_1728403 [Phellopilus nigrolimitatus]|nr:hypothetical protein DFH11DRAFT_1728403 [Phellopilus nigrolimitatus]
MSMGVDAKRRRFDERADSTHVRPDRSRSPVDNHSQPFLRPLYFGIKDDQQQHRKNNSMLFVGCDLDTGISTAGLLTTELIPSGPRLRNQPTTINLDFREPADMNRRQPPPAGLASYNRQPQEVDQT